MNINLHRRRRLRNTQPILTRVQIRDIGKLLGYSSFRQSVEFLMDPYNYFQLSKVKMADVHRYLLEKGITQEKCPTSHIRQSDHSRMLISILFPGYSTIKASEQYYRYLRENRSPQARLVDLAYDQLPTTDKYERLDELFRSEVTWHQEDSKSGYSISIPLKKLNRSVITEGHASSNINVRLFLYLWSSERMVWSPSKIQLFVDQGEKDELKEDDRKLHGFGFKHIDITDKSDKIKSANRRSTGSVDFRFEFEQKRPNIRHVSVCAVIEKSKEELASQLYVQTAALYIGRAMEKSSRNVPLAQKVQDKVVQLLNKYNTNDKLEIEKTCDLFISCADAFIEEWNEVEADNDDDDDDDIEVYTGEEVVSMLDPISIAKIQHPTRCIFCKHNTSFDAVTFFEFQITSMNWKCPLCQVKIRGIQDLYIDYHTKKAILKYPQEEKFMRDKNDNYTRIDLLDNFKKRPDTHFELISIKDEDNDSVGFSKIQEKKKRDFDENEYIQRKRVK